MISLIRQNERIRLIVSDNGRGLAENREKGMGIQNVESRVKVSMESGKCTHRQGKV